MVGTGGAINNTWGRNDDIVIGVIGNITGNFIGNSALDGGAIHNESTGTIGDINANFFGNYVAGSDMSSSGTGGAIYNLGKLGNLSGSFVGNYVNAAVGAGGAINNAGTIQNINADFIGNSAFSTNSILMFGGAIYNKGTIGQKDSDGKVVGGIINSNFVNNHIKLQVSDSSLMGKGGAIYTT